MSHEQDRLTLREKILRKRPLSRQREVVPEWEGAVVYIRAMSAKEKDAFEEAGLNADGKTSLENFRARLVAACMEDEHGQKLCTDVDLEELGGQEAGPIGRLFEIARRLNGMVPTEDAVKN